MGQTNFGRDVGRSCTPINLIWYCWIDIELKLAQYWFNIDLIDFSFDIELNIALIWCWYYVAVKHLPEGRIKRFRYSGYLGVGDGVRGKGERAGKGRNARERERRGKGRLREKREESGGGRNTKTWKFSCSETSNYQVKLHLPFTPEFTPPCLTCPSLPTWTTLLHILLLLALIW